MFDRMWNICVILVAVDHCAMGCGTFAIIEVFQNELNSLSR